MIILRKVGKVLNIENDKVYIVTKENEFCVLKKNHITPVKGEPYGGEIYKKPSPLKKLALILGIFLFLVFLVEGFLYFRTQTTLIVDMGSSFKVNINNLGVIIKVEGNNSNGRNVIKNNNLKFKNLDEGLTKLLTDSIKLNYIGTSSSKTNQITIFVIEGPKKFQPRYDNFKNAAKNKDIKITINNDGKGTIE